MELLDYLRILRRRGWVIILLTVIAAVSAYGFSKTMTPIYRAEIKLNVMPARADWGLVGAAKDLLRNYGINIRSHKTAQKVIDRAQLDMTTYDLLAKMNVNPETSDFTILIDTQDPNPNVAIQIVQTAAEVFVEDRLEWNAQQDKRDRIEVSIVDDARDAPLYSPKTKINTLAGGIAGALLGGIIVFFLEWLESNVVHTSQDVERTLGVPVLGAIPVTSDGSSTQRWLRIRRR
ncbi:MAG: Wzz/FepE/Etk N-terminal domain-containing protein [Chloroflexota bacterium]|nr:Wzz/FepE/Etk N-terminal domain-containing protein [Chloroflexota bacterium]